MTDKELKALIIENMEGIILDKEARDDKEILDFYARVFLNICKEYAKSNK